MLLSVTADLGRTAVVPDGIGTAYINQHLTILRTTTLVPRFLSAYLTSPAGQLQVHGRNSTPSKQGSISTMCDRFSFQFRRFLYSTNFARRVAAVEILRSSHRASLVRLDAVLFASLQHRAFRGELWRSGFGPTTPEKLHQWLAEPEGDRFEFKEAKPNYHFEKLVEYCVALANEGGGKIIFGVTDRRPRQLSAPLLLPNRAGPKPGYISDSSNESPWRNFDSRGTGADSPRAGRLPGTAWEIGGNT